MDGDDWRPGDLALCVKGGLLAGSGFAAGYPKSGRVYTVSTFVPGMVFVGGIYDALTLRDGPINADGTKDWAAHRFIKITPEAADEFDQEIISLMNTKPVPAEGV